MPLKISSARSIPARAACTVRFQAGKKGLGEVSKAASAMNFSGKPGASRLIDDGDSLTMLVGIGTDDLTGADLRKIGAAIAKTGKTVASVAADLGPLKLDNDQVQALAEGIHLGSYKYIELKSDAKANKLTKVSLVGAPNAALKRADAVGDAVNWARDQVNRPGGTLTPAEFATEAQTKAKALGLKTKVMTKAAITRARMGGLLGVNAGSELEPRFVELTYTPTGKAKGNIALVGKGITFDSGGLSIKTSAGMTTMKCDMGGGAAVLGAMFAIAQLKPKVKVTAYVPMTDNMTGGDATRPGDVLKARNGKTIEVLNTDAEGRLILADALSLASESKPDLIVDCATLTGACMVALGTDVAGVFGNSDELCANLIDAGAEVGEELWQLPLQESYRKLLDSSVADVKNVGGRYGGAITAALFLSEFVGKDLDWAHIDLAAPAFRDSAQNFNPKGGTGFGVRTLAKFVENYAAS